MKKIILLLCLVSLNAIAQKETLIQTYQRELAFLNAQKRSLTKQQTVIETQYGQKVRRAKVNLDKAQNDLVSLTKKNELLSAKVIEAERNLENVESSNSLLDTALLQGKVTLGFTEEEWDVFKSDESKITGILAGARGLLDEGSKVHHADGEFFTREGKLVQGGMIKLGRIASFGLFENQASMLMPVGLGKLKLTEQDLTHTLSQFKSGEFIGDLPVFLYETTSKGVEVKKDKSFVEMIEAGGSIAYVIVGLGILAMVLVVIRGFLLFGASRVDKMLINEIEAGELNNVEAKVALRKTPFDRVVGNTLLAKNKEREARETIIHESILGELNFLDKFGAIILVMAAVAPLLGLLGTVTGMISTFDIITEFGTGDPKLLSSGISEALITTKLGLVVAIPALLLGNLLGGWSNKIKIMLEREALRLSNRFEKEVTHA
jgi:biopolymer transport protein ExbB